MKRFNTKRTVSTCPLHKIVWWSEIAHGGGAPHQYIPQDHLLQIELVALVWSATMYVAALMKAHRPAHETLQWLLIICSTIGRNDLAMHRLHWRYADYRVACMVHGSH
jgi:hypothetical protein